MKSFAEVLREHNIGLTEDALTKALHNDDPDVRINAAMQLASSHPADAVPALTAALHDERVPHVQVALASALAGLNAPEGFQSLANICANNELDAFVRMDAARHLANRQDGACLSDVLTVSESSKDWSSRTQAISLISSFQTLPEYDSARVHKVLILALNDKNSAVQLSAINTANELHDQSLMPALKEQLSREKDTMVRDMLQQSIVNLQGAH